MPVPHAVLVRCCVATGASPSLAAVHPRVIGLRDTEVSDYRYYVSLRNPELCSGQRAHALDDMFIFDSRFALLCERRRLSAVWPYRTFQRGGEPWFPVMRHLVGRSITMW